MWNLEVNKQFFSTFHDYNRLKLRNCYIHQFSAICTFLVFKMHSVSHRNILEYFPPFYPIQNAPMSSDQGEILPQGTFVPSGAAWVIALHCSSKWVRNTFSASSCEPTSNLMLLELPCRLQVTPFVVSCWSLPALHSQVTPCHSAQRFSPGRTAALSLWEQTEQGHHMSVTAPEPPGKGVWRRSERKTRQLLQWGCLVIGKGVVARQGDCRM